MLVISCVGCLATGDTLSGSSEQVEGTPLSPGSLLEQLGIPWFASGGDNSSTGFVLPFGGSDGADRSDPTPGGDFEQIVRDVFTRTSENFSGAAQEMDSYQITIYDLITEKEIADPAYLGREKGVKITIVLKNSLDDLQNSLWGHETDATLLARAYYTGDLKDEIGFVAVTYKLEQSTKARASFKLDAVDAERYEGLWTDGRYIRKSDWSETVIDPAAGIANYENPVNMILPAVPDAPLTSNQVSVPDYGEETLTEQIRDSTTKLILITGNIAEKADQNDYQEMSYLSDLLIEEARNYQESIASLPVSPELQAVKEHYVEGLIHFQHAGSSYWYGATHTRSAGFEQGGRYLDGGLAEMNSAFSLLGIPTIESNVIKKPQDSLYPDALALNQRYMYQDAAKINDISVKVEKYEIKSGYYIEEDGVKEHVTAGHGYKFLTVVVWVTHLGYRGGGSELIRTPAPADFTVISGSEEYKDVTPSVFMQPIGVPYKTVTLNRKERTEGVLIFAVPETFNPGESYILLDPGNGETAVWKLVTMGPSSVIAPDTPPELPTGGWEIRTGPLPEEDGQETGEALSLTEEYFFVPSGAGSDIGLSVRSYDARESYILKEGDEIHRIEAGSGNVFIFAVVAFTNPDAAESGESWEIGVSPGDITLTCSGVEYDAKTPAGFIEGNAEDDGWNSSASGGTAERHLAFRVPDTVEIDDAFISIEYGDDATAVWELA